MNTIQDPMASSVTDQALWTSFFNQVFAIAEDAVSNRKIPMRDLEEEEPYVFLALIGSTVLACLERPVSSEDAGSFQLAAGLKVDLTTLHPDHRETFLKMRAIRQSLSTVSQEGLWCLQQLVLYGNSNHKVVTKLADSQVLLLRRIAADIQSVAIYISQQRVFLQQFASVPKLLLCKRTMPAQYGPTFLILFAAMYREV